MWEQEHISDDKWEQLRPIFERGAERGKGHTYSRMVYGVVAVAEYILCGLDLEVSISDLFSNYTHRSYGGGEDARKILERVLYLVRRANSSDPDIGSMEVYVFVESDQELRRKVYAIEYSEVPKNISIVRKMIEGNEKRIRRIRGRKEIYAATATFCRFFGVRPQHLPEEIEKAIRQKEELSEINRRVLKYLKFYEDNPGKVNIGRMQSVATIEGNLKGTSIRSVWGNSATPKGRFVSDGVIIIDASHLPNGYADNLRGKKTGRGDTHKSIAPERMKAIWKEITDKRIGGVVAWLGGIQFAEDLGGYHSSAFEKVLYYHYDFDPSRYGLVDARKVYWCARRVGASRIRELKYRHSSHSQYNVNHPDIRAVPNVPRLDGVLVAFKGDVPVFSIKTLTPFASSMHRRSERWKRFKHDARMYCIDPTYGGR
jgi:hypothetical protein